jgi:hypothetical protein
MITTAPQSLKDAALANGHILLEAMDQSGLIVSCNRCHCGQTIDHDHVPTGWLHIPCAGTPYPSWSEDVRRLQDERLEVAQEAANHAYVRAHPKSFDAATRWRYDAEEIP